MTAAGPPGSPSAVRTSSIRVALATTAIVAAAYLVICIAVVAIVSSALTRDIDQRLGDSLAHIGGEPPPPDHGYDAPPGGPKFGPQLLVWTIHPDGSVSSNTTDAVLPVAYLGTTGPTTVEIGDAQVRIQGAPTESGYVVVGQTTRAVDQARTTLVLAELIITPILLIVVFLGAVAIGRRVAAPIEQARVRQLEFTADASHELRTPLSVIEAHTSLALAQDRDAACYRTAFGKVDIESKRMRRLVEDLLWLARFDATREPPDLEPVDLGVLASETVDRFRVVGEARGLAIELRVDAGDHIVHVPPEWLDRLLGVLLDNACKYAPARHRRRGDRGERRGSRAADRRRRRPGHPGGGARPDLRPLPSGDRVDERRRARARDRRRDRAHDGRSLAGRCLAGRRCQPVGGLEARDGLTG